MKSRKVISGILNHCYQRTIDGYLLFYSISDYLVFFTIFCTAARRYRVRVLSLCLMPDHYHISIVAESAKELSGFIRDINRVFVPQNNSICHRSGPLLEKPFGSVPVRGDKNARTNLCYVGNNGVERQLSKRAEDYRWNFLAYYNNTSPFSEPLVIRRVSWSMRMTLQEIRACHKQGRPLSYNLLQRLFKPLDRRERLQLVDFIINSYNIIDYESAIRFFDNYDDMLTAMHSNTGSEHNLNEIFIGRSDACYAKMTSILMKELEFDDIHDFLALPEKERIELFAFLCRRTDAIPKQVAKYLRIKLKKAEG